MACYTPLQAWYSKEINTSGKRSLVFSPDLALERDQTVEIACGQCHGCRLERSRQWAVRCMHEASLYENNCFITLTFSDDGMKQRFLDEKSSERRKYMDNLWSIDVRDTQLFMKRLRKEFGKGIRFLFSGEYGDLNKRPHYHAILFNFDFPDKELWKIQNDQRYYISQSLSELWPYGHCVIGDVTFESAAYVARYVMKKVTGDQAEDHYQWADSETGEVFPLKPEFVTMSRRPGIGKEWFEKYHSDLYPKDFVTLNGKKYKPPKYYDNILKEVDPLSFDFIYEGRQERVADHRDDLTPKRLKVRADIAQKRADRLVRMHDKEI
jgi:hypothetical protein